MSNATATDFDEYGPAIEASVKPKLFVGGAPLALTITEVVANPKKPGGEAHRRYALYPTVPFTLADALAVKGGPIRADFLYDLRKGYIK